MIQILGPEQEDRVHYTPQVGTSIERSFGRDAVTALSGIGFKFDAEIE
jgi:hypothetical protein